MLTDQQAIDRALAFIAEHRIVSDDVRLTAKPEWVRRVPGAVVVAYDSAEFVEHGNAAMRLVGNLPIRVAESTGECRLLSLDEYFEIYGADDGDGEDEEDGGDPA